MNAGDHCQAIYAAFDAWSAVCAETDQGARFVTHCLYPSFDPVAVYVVGFGEGFKIHDGGGAVRSAWDHCADLSMIRKVVNQFGTANKLRFDEDSLIASVPNRDWLVPAILSVANTSAHAARAALDSVAQSSEAALKDMIFEVASKIMPPHKVAKDFELRGSSGKIHHFDCALKPTPETTILLDAVSPHHVSVASKYVAFSDTKTDERIRGRFAVHDRPLSPDDISLLLQVAEIVPFASLDPLLHRDLVHG